MPDLEEQLRSYGPVLDDTEPGVADVVELPARRRRMKWIVAAAAGIVIAVAVAAIAVAREDATHPRVATTPSTVVDPLKVPAPGPIMAIGDSVMLDARDAIFEAVPGIAIDAAVNRHMADVPEVLRTADANPATVVIALGTNGEFSAEDLDAALAAAETRQVVLVTGRNAGRVWEEHNNELMRAAVRSRGATIALADWQQLAQPHDAWFTSDGVHLVDDGRRQYAALLARVLQPVHLTVEGSYAFTPHEGEIRIVKAGGDVWIASGQSLERRDERTGAVKTTMNLPFAYGVTQMAASSSHVWVSGITSDAGPQYGLVRVDLATNQMIVVGGDIISCECRIAASDELLVAAGGGSGGFRFVDPATGLVAGGVTDVPAEHMAVVGKTLYVGSAGPAVQIFGPAPQRFEVVELPGGQGSVADLSAEPNGSVLALLSSGQVFRIRGSVPTPAGDATTVGGTIDVAERVWVAAGDVLATVSDWSTSSYAFDPASRAFRSEFGRGTPEFVDVVAFDDYVWLLRASGEVLRVGVK